jgi:hypothetical protein
MTTTENNKLIAEFMGFNTFNSQLDYKIYDIPQHKRDVVAEQNGGTLFAEMDLKFHSDWNWLMEVVEKIESLNYEVVIQNHICHIEMLLMDNIVVSEDIPKIEAVYKACISFVKWYNENKTIFNQ